MALEPIYEADFLKCSYGFRPNRSTHDAMVAIRAWMVDGKRMYYVIEGDIKGYFDTIHHKKLMSLLRRRIADKRILDLIWSFLKAGVMADGLLSATSQGTPQGGVISPLLANVYLHELDMYFQKRFRDRTDWERAKCRAHGGNNAGYVRYADDFVVLCNGHMQDVKQLKEDIAAFLQDTLHLTLSETKTKITHGNDGFDFLGFRFYRGIAGDGKWKPKTAIPDSNIEVVKTKIRHLTEHDHTYMDEAAVVAQLNAVLRGWGNYYRYTPASRVFRTVDRFVFYRLLQWFVHKYKWSQSEVLRRRYSGDTGDRRLYAEWSARDGLRRVLLYALTRDMKYKEYYPKKNGNPFLENPTKPMNEISEWRAGCGESRKSGSGEGA